MRPFVKHAGMAWVMSTLGFGVILQSLGLAVWGPKPVFVPGPVGDDILRFAGVGARPQELLMLAVAVVIMLVFDRVMRRTMLGKAMPGTNMGMDLGMDMPYGDEEEEEEEEEDYEEGDDDAMDS